MACASIDLLVWIDASSTASILSGYVGGGQGTDGTRTPGNAESVAASFLAGSETDRRWLIVLDDVADIEVLQGLWPSGPMGQVVMTTRQHAGHWSACGTCLSLRSAHSAAARR